MFMAVHQSDIQHGIRHLALFGRPVCVHASLRSFGHVEGGARTVVQAFLQEQCTLLVPTFSWSFAVRPPLHFRMPRNGWNYEAFSGPTSGIGRIYTTDSSEIDREMGVIAATVVTWLGRARGNHPLCSFAAIGPLAEEIVAGQSHLDVYAPLDALARRNGVVLLAGVGVEKMTLLHLAEKAAGRTLFRRWANDVHGQPIAVEVGSCSDGFSRLEAHLQSDFISTEVRESNWKVFGASQVLNHATMAIEAEPDVTHCGDLACERCNDAIAGGPILLE
jgi:aminoglycoside 3-N-acetyltransferase